VEVGEVIDQLSLTYQTHPSNLPHLPHLPFFVSPE
jgi:hypothetical protein